MDRQSPRAAPEKVSGFFSFDAKRVHPCTADQVRNRHDAERALLHGVNHERPVMTPEQFTYWMQGCSEAVEGVPSLAQWVLIKDHLQTVFDKVTPEVEVAAEPDVFYSGSMDPGFFQEAPPNGAARAPKEGRSRLIC